MASQYSREEMYELVWSEPLRKLAPKIGVSDTAIRKACKKSGIPLPDQGHWAKKRAGKRTVLKRLTPRFPGALNILEFGGSHYGYGLSVNLTDPPPKPPVFNETMEELRVRVVEMVGKVAFTQLSTRTHSIIRTLLAQDEDRIARQKKYASMWDAPRYVSPLGKRWLRILNALFLGAQRLGCKPYLSTSKYADEYQAPSIMVGDQSVGFSLDPVRDRRGRGSQEKQSSNQLELKLRGIEKADGCRSAWSDVKGERIESCLTEILVEIVVTGERQYREHLVWQHERILERRKELKEEEEQRNIEAAKQERERREAEEQARIDSLLHAADTYQKANIIREFVNEMRERVETLSVSSEEFDAWSRWALDLADQIDPAKNPKVFQVTLPDWAPGSGGGNG